MTRLDDAVRDAQRFVASLRYRNFVWRQPQVPWCRLSAKGYCRAGRTCSRRARHRGACEDHAIAYALVKFAAWLRSLL